MSDDLRRIAQDALDLAADALDDDLGYLAVAERAASLGERIAAAIGFEAAEFKMGEPLRRSGIVDGAWPPPESLAAAAEKVVALADELEDWWRSNDTPPDLDRIVKQLQPAKTRLVRALIAAEPTEGGTRG